MINASDNLSVYTVHCTWSTFDFIKPVILPVLALLKTVYFPLSTFDSEGGYLLLLLHCRFVFLLDSFTALVDLDVHHYNHRF